MTPTRKRGRPKNPPIDRSRYASMTIRRFPVVLLERIQTRLANLNRRQREEQVQPMSQEDFVIGLLSAALEQLYQEDFPRERK